MDIGERLRQLREHRHLSLYDVERQSGLHYSTVGKYERGVRRPSVDTLRELARVYRVRVRDIIQDDADEESSREDARLSGWLDLLRLRPALGRLLDAAVDLSDERLDHLLAFLGEAPSNDAPGGDGAPSSPPDGGEAPSPGAPGGDGAPSRSPGSGEMPSRR